MPPNSEAQPPRKHKSVSGKAKPFRTVLRQSRARAIFLFHGCPLRRSFK